MATLANPPAMADEPAQPHRGDKELQLTLYAQLGAALSARSQAELLYTAAVIGTFGAVIWGIAALPPSMNVGRAIYLRPPFAAAVGTILVALAVWKKIQREHEIYVNMRDWQIAALKQLQNLPHAKEVIPDGMLGRSGRGDLASSRIVLAAAAATVFFCFTVLWPPNWCG